MTPAVEWIVWALPVAACCGAFVGWCVIRVVGRLVEPGPARASGNDGRGSSALVVAFAAAAAALWWWEVIARGQLPGPASAAVPIATLVWRWAGHLVLGGLLAAASWIDLRDRVIPDGVTLPGVLLGLVWAGLRPDTLLPVVRAVPRSFAAPLVAADVLAVGGPLGGAELPSWLGASPAAGGFIVAALLFVVWWLGCTAPAHVASPGSVWFDPRLPVLAIGLGGIGAAWWHGGDHWVALVSGLVGMAVGMTVVWATRIGASRALGREAVGFGDVTLMAAIGAWLGWQAVLLVCCLGVFVGLVHGLGQFILARDNELPFGPSLCLGAAIVAVWWRPLWEWFGPAFARPGEIAAVAAAVIVLTALTLAAWWRLRGGRAA